ncbi:MAG: hypothetical protein KIT00_10420 [Rhodospirillales bacterium]|nr:hypothetical protein [Rhodospirillales bacterium]
MGEPISMICWAFVADFVRSGSAPAETGVPGSGQGMRETISNIIISIVLIAYQKEILDGRDAIEKSLAELATHTESLFESAKTCLAEKMPQEDIEKVVECVVAEFIARRSR